MKQMERREFLKMAGAAAIAVGLTACGGVEPSAPSSSVSTSLASVHLSNSSGKFSGSSTSSGSSSSGSSGVQTETRRIIWTMETRSDGTAKLTGYDEAGAVPSGDVTFPEELSGRKVTCVDGTFGPNVMKLTVPGTVKDLYALGSENLQEVVLQEGVERIGYDESVWAYQPFYGCKNLTKVQMPSTVKRIDGLSFAGCTKLKKIDLPRGLTYIGGEAFRDCGLTSVTVPDTVTSVGWSAFSNCDLERAEVQGTVLGGKMFAGCEKLKTVTLSENALELGYAMFSGCIALSAIQLPANLQSISREAFCGCTELSQITLPGAVVQIDISAFEKCESLQKIKIPYGVTKLDSWTFRDCKGLRSIYIPASLTQIGSSVFEGCANLEDVYYQSSKDSWQGVSIGENNGPFGSAAFHPNASEANY